MTYQPSTILVTGGAGFIGSHFVRHLLEHRYAPRILIVDALTHASRRENVGYFQAEAGDIEGALCTFVQADIADRPTMDRILAEHRPDAIVNFAAESHVDRSIADPFAFIHANAFGPAVLVDLALRHGTGRYLQVSTDEVYGSLEPLDPPYTEEAPVRPSTPYAVTKAAGDYAVLAYHHMYDLHAVVTRGSNTYGPRQHPEKYIPSAIRHALRDEVIPLHAGGRHVRDWIHVDDHCRGVWAALARGRPGQVYHFGGGAERRTIDVAHRILDHLGRPRAQTVFVADRPGNDARYGMDYGKAQRELDWTPQRNFEEALPSVIDWYVENRRVWLEG
jgi:dTDP-glucose 4,6-dehydratase